ncbi:MAG: hypothetical protein K8L91_22195 [Anaerolineae bacterium]|nr:hypothetical protein [Anaerolineae bacterium]
MAIWRVLPLALIIAFLVYEIIFGLRLMKTREYIGKRAINLFKREEYRITGDAAYVLGASYVTGCTFILFMFTVIIPIGLWLSKELATILSVLFFVVGILILFAGNIVASILSSKSKK